MLIRPLTSADSEAFHALRLLGLEETPTCFASSYEEEKVRPLQDIAKALAATRYSAVFGAFDGEQLVGIAGIRRENLQKYHHKAALWGVYVAPSGRGAGVSRKLLGQAIDFAKTIGDVRQINLTVTAANNAALRLYEQIGFKEFGRESESLFANGALHDEMHMVLRLTDI